MTVFALASSLGQEEYVSVLIDAGVDIDEKDHEGNAAIHIACSNGHKNILNCLVFHNADVTAVNNKNCNALHVAAYNGYNISYYPYCYYLYHTNCHIILIAIIFIKLLLPLICSHFDVVNTLLNLKIKIDEKDGLGMTPLLYASKAGTSHLSPHHHHHHHHHHHYL